MDGGFVNTSEYSKLVIPCCPVCKELIAGSSIKFLRILKNVNLNEKQFES